MRYADPLVVGADEIARPLSRLERAHGSFDEAFLQDLLAKHPRLLPAAELRSDVGELLCIGREVVAGRGCKIDNLYLSTGGYVVVVETKLWKNPQAKREVLSQTLDYIKQLVQKNYGWLEEQWAASLGNGSTRPLFARMTELAELADEDLDEAEFIDRVNMALKRGDVLAMIVGDGIHTELQELVAHLCRDTPHLRYALALVELACYHLADGADRPLLVAPRIVQEVEPVERAYVRVEMAKELESQTRVVSLTPAVEPDHKVRTLTEDQFYDALRRSVGPDLAEDVHGLCEEWAPSVDLERHYTAKGVRLRLPVGDAGSGAAVIAIDADGCMYNPMALFGRLAKLKLPPDISTQYWSALHRIDPSFGPAGVPAVSKTRVPLARVHGKIPALKAAIEALLRAVRSAVEPTS